MIYILFDQVPIYCARDIYFFTFNEFNKFSLCAIFPVRNYYKPVDIVKRDTLYKRNNRFKLFFYNKSLLYYYFTC